MKLKASYGKVLKLDSSLAHFTMKRSIEMQSYVERLFQVRLHFNLQTEKA